MTDIWTIIILVAAIITLASVWIYYFRRVQKFQKEMSERDSYQRVPIDDHQQQKNFELVNPKFGQSHEFTLFWLHGLGDIPSSWKEGTNSFNLERTKIILPAAPIIPVTLNGGMQMPAWFDIIGLSLGTTEDKVGIRAACEQLASMIEKEIKEHNIHPKNIAVGGFSQGGAVALHTCLVKGYLKHKIGAVVGLSCWLPLGSTLMDANGSDLQLSKLNRETSLFMGHGINDPLVRLDYGELTFKMLKRKDSEFKQYRMNHETCTSELRDVSAFLKRVFKM